MLELIFQKRMKDRFKSHFGTDFDDFLDQQNTNSEELNDAEKIKNEQPSVEQMT